MWLKSVIFLVFLTSGSFANAIVPFITDGFNGDIRELPFIVSIQRSPGFHWCNGALLNSKFILTAASLLWNHNATQFVVEYGNTVIVPTNSTNKIRISQMFIHPEFNATTLENDIAILQMESDAQMENFILPFASLATTGTRFSSGTLATHAGFGFTAPGAQSFHIQRANLRIISHSECREAVGESRQPNFQNICAMDTSVICSGDVGIPLLVNRILVGIASSRGGTLCVQSPGEFPNIFTAVSFYIGWIESVTGIRYSVNTFLSL